MREALTRMREISMATKQALQAMSRRQMTINVNIREYYINWPGDMI
jgi:hypothetical protein